MRQLLLDKFNIDIGFDFTLVKADICYCGRTRYPKQAGHWRSNQWGLDLYDSDGIAFSLVIGSKAECKKIIKEILS